MLPIPIYKAPLVVRHVQAVAMAKLVDLEYRAVTRKENRLPKHDAPVVCASTSGIAGYWSLECNDPEMPRETLDQIVANLRKWEGAPADPNRMF